MMMWKCCTQYANEFGKLSSGHRTGKHQFFIQIRKKGNAKECSNHCTITLISHASKILQVGFNSTWTKKFQMYKLDLEKAEEPEIQHPLDHRKRKFQKKSTSASLTTLKPLTVWITTNYGKFFKRWEYQTTLPVSWETCMQVKNQQIEPDMEQ